MAGFWWYGELGNGRACKGMSCSLKEKGGLPKGGGGACTLQTGRNGALRALSCCR